MTRCPVCHEFEPLCTCPPFNEALHENEAAELLAEDQQAREAFRAERDEP